MTKYTDVDLNYASKSVHTKKPQEIEKIDHWASPDGTPKVLQ